MSSNNSRYFIFKPKTFFVMKSKLISAINTRCLLLVATIIVAVWGFFFLLYFLITNPIGAIKIVGEYFTVLANSSFFEEKRRSFLLTTHMQFERFIQAPIPVINVEYWKRYLTTRAHDRVFLSRANRWLIHKGLNWSLENRIDNHPPKSTPFDEVLVYTQALLDTQTIWERAENAPNDTSLSEAMWKAVSKGFPDLAHRIHNLYLQRYPLPDRLAAQN